MKVLAIILIVIVVLAILYFLMIMPRMAHKPDTACFKEWLYAHRGLHDNATQAPENSMAAFRKAVDAGFGIELDIQLTKDKIPVVFHDFTLKRVCGGEGKISGTVIGVIILGILDNGLVLMSVNTNWQSVIKGLILLAAVAIDCYQVVNKNKKKAAA